MTQLIHEGCGARILHLGNEDPENLFCLSLQTLPRRSDGAPHILEHTVLCGSRKYPVKDPFFGMIRRSLNTFMNAMTGDDITFYPAASQLEKDFYNLLDVYLDAVFFPRLSRLSFLQEGHRLELADSDDPQSELVRKGVVYNEMKGAMASADARAWHRLVESLYPSTPYRFNSGGDPRVIPQLTYEELLDFHRTYYHPSRCLFFFYGNLPLEKHLEYLHVQLLRDAERLPPLPPIPSQERFKRAVQVSDTFPIATGDDLAGKGMLYYGTLTARITEPEEVLALGVLDLLLTGTDASPLKLALLKSGLCKEAYSFLSSDMADVPFVVICKGIEAKDAAALEELVVMELERLESVGFPADQIEAAIHQFEFSRTEIKGDSAPYGLTLFRRSGPLLLFGVDPEIGLRVHTLFKRLRDRLLQPGALGRLIRQYLLNNPHRCRLLMTPDVEQAAREESEEKSALAQLKSKLSPDQIGQLIEQERELTQFQKHQEGADLEVLPKITLSDVPEKPQDFPLRQATAGPFKLFHHDCFTNGIAYASVHFDLPHLEEADFPYVELFTSMLTEVGAGGRSYIEQLEYLMAHTGGLGVGVSFNPQAKDHTQFYPALSFMGKALERKVDRLFPLFVDLLTSADFSDTARLRELMLQYDSALESALPSQGLRYASSLATSAFSPSARIGDAWKGVGFLQVVRKIARDPDAQIPQLQSRLQELQARLLAIGEGHLVLSYSPDQRSAHEKRKFYGLEQLQTRAAPLWRVPLSTASVVSHARLIASPVAFTCKALPSIPYHHPDAPILTVVTRLFDHTTLHPLIREQGGAYGSGATYAPGQALLYFYAYRDPNLHSTLLAFDHAVAKIASGNFSARELEEAKLTLIQKADSPISPGSRGGVAYGWWREGKTLAMREEVRRRLLGATIEDCVRVTREQLVPRLSEAITVTCAGKELLNRENRLLAEPLELLPL
jgi:presequence protease